MAIYKEDLFDFDQYQIKSFLILLSSLPISTPIWTPNPAIPFLGLRKFDKLSVN